MNPTGLVRILPTLTMSVIALTACTAQPPAPAAPPTMAPPPANPADPRSTVQRAYEQFWAVSPPTEALPPEQWRPRLEQVAAEPMLTQLVSGFQSLHDQGIALYGSPVPHVSQVQLSGDHATVSDCQDASHAGQADARTGQLRTAGVSRNPVIGTLQLGPNGWRVTRIDYPGGSC